MVIIEDDGDVRLQTSRGRRGYGGGLSMSRRNRWSGDRGKTMNKFWVGLQSFITYNYELYEFAKRIKQYSSLNQERN